MVLAFTSKPASRRRQHGDDGTTNRNFEDPLVKPYLERVVHQLASNVAAVAVAKAGTPSLPVL